MENSPWLEQTVILTAGLVAILTIMHLWLSCLAIKAFSVPVRLIEKTKNVPVAPEDDSPERTRVLEWCSKEAKDQRTAVRLSLCTSFLVIIFTFAYEILFEGPNERGGRPHRQALFIIFSAIPNAADSAANVYGMLMVAKYWEEKDTDCLQNLKDLGEKVVQYCDSEKQSLRHVEELELEPHSGEGAWGRTRTSQ